MPQVRALTKVFHDGVLYEAGAVFEMAEELCQGLKNEVTQNIVLVTKKTEAAYAKAQQEARDALDATARALRLAYEELKSQLEADPTRGDLVQQVLDAEIASNNAAAALTEFDAKAAEQAAG